MDHLFLVASTPELLEEEFRRYRTLKTDPFKKTKTGRSVINIPFGVDGVKYTAFQADLERNCRNISERLYSGKYLFAPFREVDIPKDPLQTLAEARASDRVRTLSVASIRDVLVQRILYSVLVDPLDALFSGLGKVSYAYRKRLSASQAARQTFDWVGGGYVSVFDADVVKFFDRIPHGQLLHLISSAFVDSPIVASLLRRFVCVDRVANESYTDTTVFHRKKPERLKRSEGIPQGGVLSGLLANLYLHAFDEWVVGSLSHSHDLNYIRYADDFIILLRSSAALPDVHSLVEEKLSAMGLQLHQKKTRHLDLRKERLEFVGFAIDPSGIRVKPTNLRRFKVRFTEKLTAGYSTKKKLTPRQILVRMVRRKLQFKLLGDQAETEWVCKGCCKKRKPRSWLAFFATVTDVQQLRGLDTWMRKEIYRYFARTYSARFTRRDIRKAGLASLEAEYYKARHELKKDDEFCTCPAWVEREPALVDELSEY